MLVLFRIQILQGQVFQFALHRVNSKTMGNRSKNFDGFLGQSLLSFGRKGIQGTHVVKSIRKFNDDYTNILSHAEEDFAVILRFKIFRCHVRKFHSLNFG